MANQISTSTPLGPLQQQYHQPIYNNNFANFRTFATTTTTTQSPAPFTSTQQSNNFRNFNQIYSTPSTFSAPQRPIVSVPTPFNNHNNVQQFNNNQKIIYNTNSSLTPAKIGKSFDNHNPINNYQTTSPFNSNHPSNHNQKQQTFPTNYTNNASTRLAPAAQNQLQYTPNIQSHRNQRTNNNNERSPTTNTPQKVTTAQRTASISTYRPSFSQQDFINQYNLEQQKLSQQKQQSTERNPQTNNRNAPISLEQKRLQLHYDINDYLSTDKYTPENQYSPTSEQYRSVQTYSHPNADYSPKQNKKIVEAYTQKYNPPKQASQSQPPFTFPTSTISNKPHVEQFRQYQTQQDRPTASPQQQQASFNAPINVPSAHLQPTPNPPSAESTNQNVIPSTVKKFSTLVPKENYAPTTFKPSFYFNVAKQINDHLSTPARQQNAYVSTTTTTTTIKPQINYNQQQQPFNQFNYNQPQQHFIAAAPKTINGEIDENDGQYHPELYEKDFARYKIKNRKKTQQQQQKPFNFSNIKHFNHAPKKSTATSSEDEILNTAHSQNIAATGNELWSAANAKKAANAKNIQAQSKAPTIPPTNSTTSTKKPHAQRDDDVSYDYAYYDSANEQPVNEYSELEVVDFGKTNKQ